jgi:hypothetical protein
MNFDTIRFGKIYLFSREFIYFQGNLFIFKGIYLFQGFFKKCGAPKFFSKKFLKNILFLKFENIFLKKVLEICNLCERENLIFGGFSTIHRFIFSVFL